MKINEIARYAKIKGLQLIGTGDFTHPLWLKEIKETLSPQAESGLFKVVGKSELPVQFMLTTEVCTIFNYENESKKIHHVILAPNMEIVEQINEAIGKYGNLSSDGRPILNMTAPHLVDEVMRISTDNVIFPAHAWTPWFSVFGAFSGFDNIEDCYQETVKYIHALETGLSSDPPMNWRLSNLDKFTLVSNSDSHSFWPWRLGREANVFELENPSYKEVTQAIITKDTSKFKFTIETDPAYGKYHWTGHRNCNVSLSPFEARKLHNICPICHRELTEGVEQRVEELADRPENYKDTNSPGFIRLLPLSEIIATVLNVDSPSTQAVWKIYNMLVEGFGDEYKVLIDASKEALKAAVVDQRIAEAIVSVREGSAKVTPGYDGVYGKLVLPPVSIDTKAQDLPDEPPKRKPLSRAQQMSMGDFV
ncbi:MAG TPA: endonuclease Q family protein [Candidatus Nanoarchaeia archaeon]|nr:endonuclease Q family protein [Candidatus Nanoarchaeia archaeon]